jgi:alpha-ketoglutarate-dependent taurine dioxygenase
VLSVLNPKFLQEGKNDTSSEAEGVSRTLKSEHNTYKAEAVGMLLATWLIRRHPETVGKNVTIYMDNQALLSAISGVKKLPGQYLIQAIYNSINSLECEVRVAWISGHSDVWGNEAFDLGDKQALLHKFKSDTSR